MINKVRILYIQANSSPLLVIKTNVCASLSRMMNESKRVSHTVQIVKQCVTSIVLRINLTGGQFSDLWKNLPIHNLEYLRRISAILRTSCCNYTTFCAKTMPDRHYKITECALKHA